MSQDKQDIIKAQFADWIWKDPERRDALCSMYNERFNAVRPREYDGKHIQFHGMNPEVKLDTHQVNAVARHLYGGNALFGHVVGAGKSYEMIAAGMEAKRLGLCNKAMYVVPNNIIADFAGDFFKLYPAANVLMATAKDFEKKNRKKFCARIATGEYDGVIIAHSQFEKIPLSVQRQENSLQQQIQDVTAGIDEIKRQNGERYSIKQMERMRKGLQAKLAKLNDQSRKDSLETFEELGVDALFVDEADLFKNLYLVTKMRNVGGISQTESQKASDLFMKTRYLDEITGNRGTVFATGTPVSNSLAEVYTMQRYLQYDTLCEKGLQHFDCWASTFGETVTAMELTPEGVEYKGGIDCFENSQTNNEPNNSLFCGTNQPKKGNHEKGDEDMPIQNPAQVLCMTATQPPFTFFRTIGGTTYQVALHFSSTSKETMNDKIMRLIKTDPLLSRGERTRL